MITRRKFFTGAAAVAGAAALSRVAHAAEDVAAAGGHDEQPLSPGEAGRDYTPVITPDNIALPFKMVDGVKVFHLISEEVRDHEFAPGLKAHCWGFNGRVHGPTIEAVEGDHVRIYVTNKLPEPTSIHWHGILLPNGMDGVRGLTQPGIQPGETFKYEFTLRQHGTYMYHSHYDDMTQLALGVMGMFIIHERNPKRSPDRDFVYMLSEWKIVPGTMRPDPSEMTDFNVFTLNARSYPGTAPMVVKKGDLVRIRIGNLGAMDHHPIHLHGHRYKLVATDGGDIAESAQWPQTTVLVSVGSTRTIEFVADNPGDWPFHCHMSHHVMTQMGHGQPNLIGIDTGKLDKKVNAFLPGYMTMGDTGMGDMGEMQMKVPKNSLPMVGGPGPHGYIDMGGMFTIFKVRENISSYDDPGWYQQPPGTAAALAAADDLKRDGIGVEEPKKS
jgi:FtsP/CotA-like multicopper oxidase with cupredoxin domain